MQATSFCRRVAMLIRQGAISAMLIVLVGAPGLVLARGGGNWMPPRVSVAPERAPRMERHDMMQACQTHCQALAIDLEALRTRIQAAQASDNLVHLRAVLDDVARPLAAMQDAMAGCLDMMRLMPQRHSSMGGHGQGQ